MLLEKLDLGYFLREAFLQHAVCLSAELVE
jgi:hypothetical protein